MISIKENERMISVQYDSVLDVIETGCPSKSGNNQEMYKRRIKDKDSSGWYAEFKSLQEVINAALIGSKEIYEKHLLSKISLLSQKCKVNDYEQKVQSIKRKRIYGSQGDELDIHKVYQGQLDKAWTRTHRIEVAQKFHLVTLLIENGGLSGVNAYDTLWRSAVAVKIYDELIQAGKSVQIVVATNSHNNFRDKDPRLLTTCIPVKKYNEQLSLERLSVMSNITFFRSFGFLALLAQDHPLNYGYGHHCSIGNNMPIHLQEEIDAGHTKFVKIGMVCGQRQAIQAVANCYQQMEDFLEK